ncbi:hypothetical protein ACIRQY_11330 [Streptomyces sp. NPDC101490]|uniref:hypothetical protein n=1 Tax=Streptomyces sp. NPDC101490 TaxID=3366143 RepID=UPI003822DFAD
MAAKQPRNLAADEKAGFSSHPRDVAYRAEARARMEADHTEASARLAKAEEHTARFMAEREQRAGS